MTAGLSALWLRWELRRRWRQLLLLTLLVAVTSGALLAGVAGARRGASAVDRLTARTLPATAVIRTNQTQVDYWPRIRALPGVAAVSLFAGYSGFGVDQAPADTVAVYLPTDDVAMRQVERPVVLAGRLANPARDDEAVVTEAFVQRRQLGVGDRVTVRLFSLAQGDAGVNAVHTTVIPRPAGPAIRTIIVGVVRSPWFSDEVGGPGRLIPSPGLAKRYPKNVLGARLDGEQWGLVRLADGDAGLPRLRAQLSALVVGQGADVIPRSDALHRARSVSRFEAACLLGVAGAVLLAGVFLVGTAVARQVAATRTDLDLLIALGLTPRQSAALAAVGPAVAGLAGGLLGAGSAVILSRWLPFGVAADLEPAPGIDVDVPVLVAGVLLAATAVAGWASLSAALLRARRLAAGRASAIAAAAARAGIPAPVVVGLRHALDTRSGRGSIPVRSALAGAVIGVLGVVAAATFGAGVDDAAGSPQRFGQHHQLEVAFGYDGQDLSDVRGAETIIDRDPAVISRQDVVFQTAQLGDRQRGADRSVFVFGSDDPGAVVLLRGRPATAPGEIVLASATAGRLHADVGSTVPARGQLPAACTRPDATFCPPAEQVPGVQRQATLRVTGVGFAPQTEYTEYDTGAWVAASTYRQLFGAGFINHEALLRLRPGSDPAAVAAGLRTQLSGLKGAQNQFISGATPVQRALDIGDLRVLPLTLGVILGLLALAATAHALLVSAQRRQHEVAVLRSLGMTRSQARLIGVTQAAVFGLVGLLVGLPLGVAAGRLLWREVSERTPLYYLPPASALAVLLAVPVTLAAVQLLALPAARRTLRPKLADLLRAE